MPQIQFIYFQNIRDEPVSFIDPRPMAAKMNNNDILPVVPGGYCVINVGRIKIEPGQFMKVPWALWNMALAKQDWTRQVTVEEWLERVAAEPVARDEHDKELKRLEEHHGAYVDQTRQQLEAISAAALAKDIDPVEEEWRTAALDDVIQLRQAYDELAKAGERCPAQAPADELEVETPPAAEASRPADTSRPADAEPKPHRDKKGPEPDGKKGQGKE